MAVPLTILISYGVAIIALWAFALRDCVRCTVFGEGSKRAWFVVVLLGPVVGSVAYLTAKRCVQKFSAPDPERLQRLLSKGR